MNILANILITILQKMLVQNRLSNENITNIRKNMSNILSDENNFKRAIKYVTKYNQKSPSERHNYRNIEKSASPLGQRPKYRDYALNATPIRRVLNITKEPLYRYNNTMNNDLGNDLYLNKNNKDNIRKNKEEYYGVEISSVKENGMPQSKSPEQIKYKNDNIRNDEDNDDNNNSDIKELITTIEDLQSIINGQRYELKSLKKENRRKDKEIEYLKNEVDNLKNEIE